ncbi:class 1 fructose-bisphosphatase [Catenovulum sp. SM1970]|uniref:class 1 fructose-bisphosphatase n=1 Tax=Marinifaba aquimaris TaxID=2741323 RepID=UPI001573C7E1|nr:class 1 fructose-bisphosphatase [Marinifaba aquimaris]NTS75675.1 class 1 fructose-bisphosphatase [Marinifaba aquimaris]
MQRLTPTLRHDGVGIELIALIRTILAATKEISFRVSQAELAGILGSTLDENIQGETQKKLDVVTNQLLKDMLLECEFVRAIASEEEPNSIAATPNAPFVVAFDPLDGSSNIDINGAIGTIFTIYQARGDVSDSDPKQFLQGGRKQVCAGYVLYGASTKLVMTTGGPTRGYTLDRTHGGYLLTTAEFAVPSSTQMFAINMANQRFWQAGFKAYVDDLLAGETGKRGKRFNMRWNAAMVADVHRTLEQGGLFAYPSDNRDKEKRAKLRLLYEANPMAMLIEHAGGKAYTEQTAILDIEPTDLHQRVAVILGSQDEVETCLSYLADNQ